MTVEVRVPQLPESVADATLVSWHKKPGDAVARDENLVDLETDKVVLEVPAPVAGVIKEIKLKDGTTVTSGQILAVIEEAASATPGVSAPAILAKETVKPAAAAGSPLGAAAAFAGGSAGAKLSPAARRVADENQIDPSAVSGSGRDGRISKSDVVNYLQAKDGPAGAPAAGVSSGAPAVAPPAVAPPPAVAGPPAASPPTGAAFGVSPVPTPQPLPVAPAPQVASAPAAKAAPATTGPALRSARADQRVPMTRLRARIAERMVQAQSTQALLTSFNEVDLKAVNDLRARYKEAFEKQHGIKLGFMSFFARACIEGLKKFPAVNASVDGQDIVYHEYYDLGIAVSTDRGLIVPIVRDADQLSFAEMEKSIGNFATRARSGTITMQELSGGTFTITNGGIFGSLLSTPIVNFPQSAILGMHKIQDRPVVVDGEVVVRPMMYVALTYDHRIIDGREAVQFLVAVKQGLEDPARMVLGI